MYDYLDVINENISTSFYTMNESVQADVAEKVLDKVFALTVGKYNKINFSDIEKTRGDITKLKFYKNLKECVQTLSEIRKVTNQIPVIETIDKAISNVITLKGSFEKSFRVKNNFGIMIYNLIVYSIMESTSYTIATSINFLSDTSNEVIISDTNSPVILADSLNRFNQLCVDGTIYKFLTEADRQVMTEGIGETLITTLTKKINPKEVAGWSIILVAGFMLLRCIVPLVRDIVYYIYKARHTVSEAAEVQANMLEMNIAVLKEKGAEPKILIRQQRHANRFRKIADAFSLESDKGQRDSKLEIKKDKIDVDSVLI